VRWKPFKKSDGGGFCLLV